MTLFHFTLFIYSSCGSLTLSLEKKGPPIYLVVISFLMNRDFGGRGGGLDAIMVASRIALGVIFGTGMAGI